jgi:DNA polymerase-3 subunit beta
MRFTIPKESILEELQLLQGIVEKRNTMPILANVLMNVTKDEVELTGTDLEVGLKTHFAADIGKSLADGGSVVFEMKDDQLEIRSGESEFKVLCLPKEDYPQVPEPRFEKGIRLPLAGFKDMIDRVYYAITQEQRYYLNGALLTLRSKEMELVSTDGHRLSFVSSLVDGLKMEKDLSVIVAKKTLSEIRKFDDETVEFDLDDNNLFFRVNNRTLISRVIESKFPNYKAVIPKDNPNALTLSREALAGAIRRVYLLSAERSKGIKFSLEKNHLRLFSSNPEIGEARDKLTVDYKGDDVEIGFNAQYLKPEHEEGVKNIYVLMPMKI